MFWKITSDKKGVEWLVKEGQLHTDDIEMDGHAVAYIVEYGVKEEGLHFTHQVIFPTLRKRPNETIASYRITIPDEKIPHLFADGGKVEETLVHVRFDGILTLQTTAGILQITHKCYPAEEKRAAYTMTTVKNTGDRTVMLSTDGSSCKVDECRGPMGINICELTSTFTDIALAAGEEYSYALIFTGRIVNEEKTYDAPEQAYLERLRKVDRLTAPLQLDTGNEILDTEFRLAKFRAGEAVFRTRFGYGLLHSPGGYYYFAASWCNDQGEYSGPYFAYTGDCDLKEAAMNAYRMYIPFMSDEYQPIPSSVIAEGLDYWDGAGDRGDAAMYLYGASLFVLTAGNPDYAQELLPAIRWCAEYCKRKTNEQGVVESDCDELESRFPAGHANLCTSCLAYAGYKAAASVVLACGGSEEEAAELLARSEALGCAIDRYFGTHIHNVDTYKYYEDCDVLRSWICMPLCVNLLSRAQGTIRMLTSDRLLRSDGLLTAEGNETIWDRSTLYALKGIFASGDTKTGCDLLLRYSANRLLGERVPYPVEAYPEAGKRHLSGESALYCKIILEGILNITPHTLTSFSIKPALPDMLDHLNLCGVYAHGACFDIHLTRDGYRIVRSDGKILARGKNGEQKIVSVL